MKKWFYMLFALVLVLAGTGCTQKNENTETKKEAITELTLVLDWYTNAIHAPIYAAMEKGYFEEEGIKLNIQYPANVTDPLTLVAAKQADLGLYYQQETLKSQVNQNVPVISLGAYLQTANQVIISLKEQNITEPKDLVGKTMGYASTELEIVNMKEAVKYQGGNPEQVKLVDIGFDILTALTTKKVDAVSGAFINHEVPVLLQDGFDINYFAVEDFGVPQSYGVILVGNQEAYTDNPEKYEKFLKALTKGFEFTKNHPEEALQIVLDAQEADAFPLDPKVEKMSLDTLLPIMETPTAPFLSQTEETWQKQMDYFYEKKFIEEKKDVKSLFRQENQ